MCGWGRSLDIALALAHPGDGGKGSNLSGGQLGATGVLLRLLGSWCDIWLRWVATATHW